MGLLKMLYWWCSRQGSYQDLPFQANPGNRIKGQIIKDYSKLTSLGWLCVWFLQGIDPKQNITSAHALSGGGPNELRQGCLY